MADDQAQMADAADRPLADFNIFDPDLLQDPHAYYRRLREEAPVFRDPRTGIVTVATYDLIMRSTGSRWCSPTISAGGCEGPSVRKTRKKWRS